MNIPEFFRKYANMPLTKRMRVISTIEFGFITWSDLYEELTKAEDKRRKFMDSQRGYRMLEILEKRHWTLLENMDKK